MKVSKLNMDPDNLTPEKILEFFRIKHEAHTETAAYVVSSEMFIKELVAHIYGLGEAIKAAKIEHILKNCYKKGAKETAIGLPVEDVITVLELFKPLGKFLYETNEKLASFVSVQQEFNKNMQKIQERGEKIEGMITQEKSVMANENEEGTLQ